VLPLRVLSRTNLSSSSRRSNPKPQRFSELRTLDFSLRSFSHADPLFSITSALFLQNTRGGIPPRDIVRCTEAQKRLSISPLLATLTHSLSRKSFPCHSYANTGDGGATQFPFQLRRLCGLCASVANRRLEGWGVFSSWRLGDFAALGQRGDAVGGAEGEGFDGHGGLAAAGGDQAAAVAEEEIFHVVGLVVGIDYGGFGVVAHAAGPEEVHGEFGFLYRVRPLLSRAGGIEELVGPLVLPSPELEVVGMIFVREAQRGKPPGVLEVGIKRKAVVLHRQRGAVSKNLHGSAEIVGQRILEGFAPAWRGGRQATLLSWRGMVPPNVGPVFQRKAERRHVEARVESAATVEAD